MLSSVRQRRRLRGESSISATNRRLRLSVITKCRQENIWYELTSCPPAIRCFAGISELWLLLLRPVLLQDNGFQWQCVVIQQIIVVTHAREFALWFYWVTHCLIVIENYDVMEEKKETECEIWKAEVTSRNPSQRKGSLLENNWC
jgi:hypothetical protein